MTRNIRHHAARVGLIIGLAAGAWSLAASAPGAETVPPADPVAPGIGAHGVLLAQATPPAAEGSAFAETVAGADIAAGQATAAQCVACHTLGEGEGARFGPNLYGIVDRPVASVSGFAYSPAMAAAGAEGHTWTIDFLNAFLESPQTAIPGTTMPFAGIEDEATRANLIGYLATLGGEGAAAGAEAPAGIPVTYTAEQAERGERRYARDCEECHGDTLDGGLIGGPPLRGLAFEAKYLNGAPASALFLFTSTAMPPDNPGRFNASVYADLVAYILQQNGFTAGNEEFPADVEALGNLIMER